jgi:hypothetical protein
MSEQEPSSQHGGRARGAREYVWFSVLLILIVLFMCSGPRP